MKSVHSTAFRWCAPAAVTLFVATAAGCASRRELDVAEPRIVEATPAEAVPVYIQSSHYVEQPPAENPQIVGYETLSSGDNVHVVTYVHTYPEPIETYPRVYWAGRWYYNINGDFVFWSDYYGTWCYYWGPPQPLVVVWNWYYPWAPYYWGLGFYGAGWYWGGVGIYGYHAWGLPVTHHHHHHYHHYHEHRPSHHAHGDPNRGGPKGGGPPSGPGTSDDGPTKPSRRPTTGAPPPDRRATRGDGAPARRQDGLEPASPRPDRAPVNQPARPTREVADRAPTNPAGPSRGLAAQDVTRQPEARPARTRYVTPGGQEVTVIGPPARQPSASRSRSLGEVPTRGPTNPPERGPTYRPDVIGPAPVPAPWGAQGSAPRPSPSMGYAPQGSGATVQPGRAPAPSFHGDSRSPSRSPSSSPSPAPSSSPGPSRAPGYAPAPSRSPSAAPSRPPSSAGPSRPSAAPARAPSPSPSRAPSSGGARPSRGPR